MYRKIFKQTATGLLAMVAVGALAQDAPPKVEVTALKGSLHLLQGRGGNVVASVGDDGILIVDDDYTEYAEAYQSALNALGGDQAVPRFVLNTHWHWDHTGGNEYWGTRGATLVAHDNVRQRMSTRQDMKVFNRVVEASPAAALPVITFAESMALHFNGEAVELQHYPAGHTDGDSMVFFSGHNVMHMGDHYFKDRFPFVDLASGGNVFSFVDNIAAALAQVDDKTVIIPGHGAIANKADLQRYHQMLVETTSLVKDRLAQGMSADDIAKQGLGDQWSSWGSGFIKEDAWVGFIAASL
jgi:cyclase